MQATLYYNNGSSDKIYQADITESGSGFLVNFAYGRRGNSLKSGSKTKEPVTRDKAQTIFDKLIKSKISKGYTPQEDGAVYSAVDSEQSQVICQLLNPINEEELSAFLMDDRYLLQEKFDGVRQSIEKTPESVRGINRKGLYVGTSNTIIDALNRISCRSITLDGEGLGDSNAVFDIIELNGESLAHLSYDERYKILVSLHLDASILPIVKSAYSSAEKLQLFNDVKSRNGEGVVFKKRLAQYTSGRPSTGGDQLKFKFYATATVQVSYHNVDRRSVGISVLYDGNDCSFNEVGNVTIPPNHPIPDVGQLVEVRYLYAYKNGGSLYQPTYLGLRTDKDYADTTSQLKYKPT
mgnify:CR=1 FL=1